MKFALALLCFSLIACATPLKRPFLWKIEKDGESSYLFGTIHQGVPYQEIPSSVWARVDEAGAVYTETGAWNSELEKRAAFAVDQIILRKDELLLWQRLSPQAWGVVRPILLRKMGDQQTAVDRLTPFGAYVILSNEPEFQVRMTRATANQMDPKWSMDPRIEARVSEKGKVLGALDDPADFSGPEFRECLSRVFASAINEMSSRSPDDFAKGMKELTSAYRSGDVKTIGQALEHSLVEDHMLCLLEDRNKKWVDVIDRAHSVYAPVFIAAGVGHMALGENNLLNLLRKRGFRVERVENVSK